MAEITEQDHVERITDRLRRDHPDPKIREQFYEEGGLPEYVRSLMQTEDDAELIDRVTSGVRAAEDGQPGPQ
ncbi:hypothetical protein BH11MYX3_BH11MYX3_38950 [soil metagenome]